MKVTPEEVKKAAAKLKAGKGDPTLSFSLDCLKWNLNCWQNILQPWYKASCFIIKSRSFSYLVLPSLSSRTSFPRSIFPRAIAVSVSPPRLKASWFDHHPPVWWRAWVPQPLVCLPARRVNHNVYLGSNRDCNLLPGQRLQSIWMLNGQVKSFQSLQIWCPLPKDDERPHTYLPKTYHFHLYPPVLQRPLGVWGLLQFQHQEWSRPGQNTCWVCILLLLLLPIWTSWKQQLWLQD